MNPIDWNEAPMVTTIENWVVYKGCLLGDVFGHPDVPSGERAITSPIKMLCLEYGWVTTQNRKYFLGNQAEPDGTVFAKRVLE